LFEQRDRDAEADEVVVIVRGISAARDFQDIEPKFRLDVCERVFLVGDPVAVPTLQLRIENRNGAIRGDTVAMVIGGIVSEGAESEGVVIQVLRIAQQGEDEVSAANIVSQTAEEMISVRVIAEVLNDGAAVSVAVRFFQLLGRSVWKTLQEQRTDIRLPRAVDNGFMREDRVGCGRFGPT